MSLGNPIYLYVTPFFPSPTSWRGAFCYDFVRALQNTGKYDVRVFKPGAGADYTIDGISVHRFPTCDMPSNIFPFVTAGINQRRFLAALMRLDIRPDQVAVCHGNSAEQAIYPEIIKKLNPNCLTLLHHHSLASFGFSAGRLRKNRLYRALQTPILRRHHKRIDCPAFISEECHRHFVSDAGFKPRQYLILNNGVDSTAFYPDDKKVLRDSFIIGTIGNFQKGKGYDLAARALALVGNQLGDWRWRIVGSGEEGAAIKCLIAELGIANHVEFLKEVPHAQLASFYRALDLFLLPSTWEGFGCVYTEAYASGVPFVATYKNNGITDLAPTEWLSEDTPEALASHILSVYRDRRLLPLKGEYRLQPLVDGFVKKIETMGANHG